MCGITGWVDYERNLNERKSVIDAMTETMALRGPDAQGVWIDRHVALGHRRLSVIDLQGGAQPMQATSNGKPIACLTYSGEVYNFIELREDLIKRGHHFETKSDTESSPDANATPDSKPAVDSSTTTEPAGPDAKPTADTPDSSMSAPAGS